MKRPTIAFRRQGEGSARCLAILLLAGNGCPGMTWPTPTHEEACLDSYKTWAVLGLTPDQVPDTPNELLQARLHVGDAAALRATTLGSPGECDDQVASVAWGASSPQVASLAPTGALGAQLEARSPGETVVWADVTLRGGATRRAELYATPEGRTAVLRVYGVQVTR